MFILKRRALLFVMAAAMGAVLCCGCSDNGIGDAFMFERLGGINDCGTDGNAGSCKTVVLGGTTWMAENLNYKTGNSRCFEDEKYNCNKFGRLYDWETAKTACTAVGWRLPDTADWRKLVALAGGVDVAGKKLRSKFGWGGDRNGTDDFGFSALPGGPQYGSFYNLFNGSYGHWWTATESSSGSAYGRGMGYNNDHLDEPTYNKGSDLSVRCVKND
jgi:uncharacterized protein (TIGR02145 family)